MSENSQASYPKRRSCARCIKAKVKCSVIEGRNICERCQRLNRDCEFGNVDLRRRRKTTTRTERLERRIEELAAQLAAHRNELPNASNNSQSSTTEETPVGLSTPPVSEEALEKVSRCASEFNDIPFPPAHPEKGADVVERGLIAPGLAEELVQKFKTAKTPVFPFVVIPPAVTAQTLRQEKPFLFLAVITACLEDDVMLQRRIAEEIRHEISTRLIMDNEKSLEMLQGLLVYLSWYYYHFVPKSHQMYLLLNIARALVFDLCLDRNPAANAQELGLLLEIKMRLALPPKCDMSDDVADGKRALLGYYYISSVFCICRKGLAMKRTPWVDECCATLVARNQHSTDASMERFLKVRSLHQNVSDTLLGDGDVGCQSDSVVTMSQKAFQSELSAIEEGMPPLSGLEYWALQTEIMTTKCAIYEVSLYMSQAPPGHSMTRISSLWNLLKSAKELVSFCFRIPDDLISHLSTASISMFWYAFMILAKVVLVPTASGWDRDTAKKEADLAGLGRAAKNKLTSIKIKENADLDQSDVWTYFCHVMKSMLAWNKKQEMGDRGSATIETSTANAPQALEKPKGIPWPPTQTAPSQHIPDFDLFPDATAQSDTRVSEVQLTPDISDQAWDASPSQDFIDETLWQRVLDDFTLLPPAPMGGFPVSAFAPYNWPLSSGNGL